MRRSLTAVLALSVCSASALAADTLRIDIKGLDGDLAANARAWVEPLEKSGYTDTPAARMNVDKTVRLSLRALGYYQPAVSMTVRDKRSLEVTVVPGEPVLISDVDVHVTGPGADERVFKFLQKRRVPKKGDVLNHAKYEGSRAPSRTRPCSSATSMQNSSRASSASPFPFARPSGPSTTRPASAGASAT